MPLSFHNQIIPARSVFAFFDVQMEDTDLIGVYRALREIHLPDEVEILGCNPSVDNLVERLIESGAAELIECEEYAIAHDGELAKWVFCRHPQTRQTKIRDSDGLSTNGLTTVNVCSVCDMILSPESEKP